VGGEEFIIILPAIDGDHGILAAKRVRSVIAERPFSSSKGPLGVTVSLGVAEFDPERHAAPEDLVADADAQLYQAKNGGRNCVMPELSRQRRRFRDADTIVNGEILRRAAAKKDEDENED
jgi:diguanylate cyclase (GGDEF)-like protein